MASPTFSGLTHLTEGSISVLARRIVMARVQRSEVDLTLRALLRLLLYGDEQVICSYTETPDDDDGDVSLIVDEDSLRLFDASVVLHSEVYYRAIHVFEGAEALTQCGYIFHLSNVLVEQGIEVVYLSTFNSDLLLVPESDIQRAHACVVDSMKCLPATAAAFARQADSQYLLELQLHASSSSSSSSTGIDLHFSRRPNRLRLATLPRSAVPRCAHALLRVLLTPPSPGRFFSYTLVRGEISLLLDAADLSALVADASDPTVAVHEAEWTLLQLNAGATGVAQNTVSVVSKILALHMIDIYYLSTASFDFIFTPVSKADKAVHCLLAADPSITLASDFH